MAMEVSAALVTFDETGLNHLLMINRRLLIRNSILRLQSRL